MVWRTEWESRTRSGPEWAAKKTGGAASLIGEVKGRGGTGPTNIPRASVIPPMEKEADGEEVGGSEAPSEVSRDDTGKGVDMGGLFDPRRSDQAGKVPSMDPLAKLQKSQVLLGQQLQTLLSTVQQLSQTMTQQAQQGQGGQQGQGQPQGQGQGQQPPQQQQGPPQGQQGPQGPAADVPPEVGPDGLVPGQQGDPGADSPEDGASLQDPEMSPYDYGQAGIPEGLAFEGDDDEEGYSEAAKRALPPRPGEAFSTPGSELAAGTPMTMRLETAIKTSSGHISPQELLHELIQAFGNSWADWEPETIIQSWTQAHGSPPDQETLHKILALQVMGMNTNGFWSSAPIFRDVILALNGQGPVLDGTEDEDTLSPGQLAYGVFVATQLTPFTQVGMDGPSDDVKAYTAIRLISHGILNAIFPLRWAQPAIDEHLKPYGDRVKAIQTEAKKKFAQVVDKPFDEIHLNSDDPVDEQVALLLSVKQYVTEMEGGT